MSDIPKFPPEQFAQCIGNAQIAYSNYDMATANQLYVAAYDAAKADTPTNWLGATMAARGVFESAYRLDSPPAKLDHWQQVTTSSMDAAVETITGVT